jgi:hypothetical protein
LPVLAKIDFEQYMQYTMASQIKKALAKTKARRERRRKFAIQFGKQAFPEA